MIKLEHDRLPFTFPEIAGQLTAKLSFPPEKLRCQCHNLATRTKAASLHPMSTITAILEPNADGGLPLPLPVGLRHRRVREIADGKPLAPSNCDLFAQG